jgi:transcriptional regulator with XRE-family HTH domain
MENSYENGSENVYKHYRLRAAQYNEALSSREKASELLGISPSSLANYELGITKTVPVDMVVMMADLYKAPELRNLYCKHECPIGRFRTLATEAKDLESITVRIINSLDDDEIRGMKKELLTIAADGKITEDEQGDFKKILDRLDGIASEISELKILAEKISRR